MTKYFQVSWSKKEALWLTLIPVIVLAILGFAFEYLEIDEIVANSTQSGMIRSALFVLQSIIILTPLFYWSKRKKVKDFGINKIEAKRTISEVLLHYLLYLGISAIVGAIIIFTQFKIPGYQAQPNILPAFGLDPFSLILAGVVIVVIAPIVEEVFFRGFLLRTLVKHYDKYLGSIASAAIFAVFHLQFQSIIPIFILGLIINSLVIRNESIVPAIAFHIMNNAIAFGLQILLLSRQLPIDTFFS